VPPALPTCLMTPPHRPPTHTHTHPPLPQYAAYGATKCALAQLLKTLQREARALPTPVRVHNVSPGMVLTPLLLEGATQQSKQVRGGGRRRPGPRDGRRVTCAQPLAPFLPPACSVQFPSGMYPRTPLTACPPPCPPPPPGVQHPV
jgi:NAD(P)-dependent dehydrogenase (short-subunit alcohol dehydrogenase family)